MTLTNTEKIIALIWLILAVTMIYFLFNHPIFTVGIFVAWCGGMLTEDVLMIGRKAWLQYRERR